MGIKNIAAIALGAYVGWKVGERVMPGTVGEIGGAVAGAAAGYWVGQKV